MAIKYLITLFVLTFNYNLFSQKIIIEGGLRIGLTPKLKNEYLGGSKNIAFTSKNFIGGGIEANALIKLKKKIYTGLHMGFGMYPTFYKIDYSKSDYLKIHPRESNKEVKSFDNMFVEFGILFSYVKRIKKNKVLKLNIAPIVSLNSYGDNSTTLIEKDSTKQIVIDYQFIEKNKFVNYGGNISATYSLNKIIYYGIFANLIFNTLDAKYSLFPNSSDYSYGNSKANLSSYGIKVGINFGK